MATFIENNKQLKTKITERTITDYINTAYYRAEKNCNKYVPVNRLTLVRACYKLHEVTSRPIATKLINELGAYTYGCIPNEPKNWLDFDQLLKLQQ